MSALTAEPLSAARQLLASELALRCSAVGQLPLEVVALGDSDVTEPEPDARATARIHVTARAVLVGPWTRDGSAPDACGHCLAIRWQRLRGEYERIALETGGLLRPAGDWPLLLPWHVDAVWAMHQRVRLDPPHLPPGPGTAGPGRTWVSLLDLATLATHDVPIVREPLCPSCSLTQETESAPEIRLTSREKEHPGAYRLRPAESYDLPEQALANSVCGVIGGAPAMDIGWTTTAPVVGTVQMRGYSGLLEVSWTGQADCYATSRGLALLEGLERYAGTHRRRAGAVVMDSYRNLGEAALDPRTCGVYPEETYCEHPLLTPFDETRAIPWTWGYSLRDDRPLLVPTRLCYYNDRAESDRFVFESSNGCAIGSCLEEAILFGMLELIERDAFVLGWYGGAELPEIDISGSRNATLHAMVHRAGLEGYDIRLFDNRIDLPVPAVTGVAVRRDGGLGALCFASGASLDPEKAIEGALSEIITYVPAVPRRTRNRRAELEAMAGDFSRVRVLRDHSALYGLPEMARHAERYLRPRTAQPVESLYASWEEQRPRTRDLLDDLRFCQGVLERAGSDVIVVDQTTPEQEAVGLSTACVIVPGLLPIDFGWEKQRALHMPRMFSAYRQAGWRTDDLTPADLHRVPHPFP
ncbi:TOMM precursor leader peptide-binding protein [Streptomyces sp. NPDC001250]|uniref:TOMM precursor leader peptide-binding protein n=1 Tax=unclassified Streptomyces TaxID=2593676 RepID=UPI00332C11D4